MITDGVFLGLNTEEIMITPFKHLIIVFLPSPTGIFMSVSLKIKISLIVTLTVA
jgi:hypothetical protein